MHVMDHEKFPVVIANSAELTIKTNKFESLPILFQFHLKCCISAPQQLFCEAMPTVNQPEKIFKSDS